MIIGLYIPQSDVFVPGLEKDKVLRSFQFLFFKAFKGFCTKNTGPDTKLPPRKNIPYTILHVTSFSINYSNKTHKSRLKYEICIKLHEK